jgi:two-component system, cell cycle response regulator CpdR
MALKILIAEDYKDLADSYRMLLETRGHEVMITSNGIECNTVYRQYVQKSGDIVKPYFDIVILDHKMQFKDGIETAKEILFLNPRQKIIFITGNEKEVESKIPQLPGFVLIMKKPFTAQALISTMEGFVAGRLGQMVKPA